VLSLLSGLIAYAIRASSSDEGKTAPSVSAPEKSASPKGRRR
jgi:hypothetical protein